MMGESTALLSENTLFKFTFIYKLRGITASKMT